MLFKKVKSLLQDKTEWLKAFLCFGIAILNVLVLSHYVKFLISETDSLPYHFFLHLPHIKPKVEDYTMVESHWYNKKIIKRIIGVAGDLIEVYPDGQILVNKHKIGIPIAIASDGRILNSIQTQTIPAGYAFLYGDHPKSFDSRYQELGLIPLSSLQGLVIPLR